MTDVESLKAAVETLKAIEKLTINEVNLNKIGMVPSGRRKGNLQVGYEIISEPQTDSERAHLQIFQEDAQDLKPFKNEEGRLNPQEKRRIIEKFASPFAQEHMDYMIEQGFKGFTFIHEDGSPFVVVTDFVLSGTIMDQHSRQVDNLKDQCTFSGNVSISLPQDGEEYEKDAFMYFLKKKYNIVNTNEDGSLYLLSHEVIKKRNDFMKKLLSGQI